MRNLSQPYLHYCICLLIAALQACKHTFLISTRSTCSPKCYGDDATVLTWDASVPFTRPTPSPVT